VHGEAEYSTFYCRIDRDSPRVAEPSFSFTVGERTGVTKRPAQPLTDIRRTTKIDTIAEAMEVPGSGVRLVVKTVAAA